MSLSAGDRVGDRYVVDGPLGEGGSAQVYAVTHTLLGTRHALKVLRSDSGEARAELLAEGRRQARLNHPNLVRVTDVIPLADGVGLVMDRIDGETLRDRLDRAPIPLPEAIAIGSGILAGLGAAHAAGLVHRDLKPANILLDPGGTPRIADFGLALPTGASADTAGTLGYLAPEAAAGRADPRADLFSAGCILYELLCGERAFPPDASQPARARDGDVVPIEARIPELPVNLAVAVGVALSPEPEGRPPDATSLAALWGGAPEPAPAPPPRRPRRWPLALLLVPVVFAGLAWSRRPEPAAWTPEQAAAFTAHLESTGLPHAENVARLTSTAIGAWYARAARERVAWEAARDDDPDALSPREHLACLQVATQIADATVRALATRDAPTSVDAGIGDPGLPDLDLCAAGAARLPWTLPDDDTQRQRVLALYSRSVPCIELSWLGRHDEADRCYATLVDEAEQTGFAPVRLSTQVQVLARRVEMRTLDPSERVALDGLIREAEETGLDAELVGLVLVAAATDLERGDERAGAELVRARTLVKRLGWPVSLHRQLLRSELTAARRAGRWQEATRIATTLRDVTCQAMGDLSANCAWEHLLLAESQSEEGRVDEAVATAAESIRLYRTGLGPTHSEQVYTRAMLGRLLLTVGRPAEAAEWLAPIPELRARHPSARVVEARLLLSWCALEQGDAAGAARELAAADTVDTDAGPWTGLRAAVAESIAQGGVTPAARARLSREATPGYRCSATVTCPALHECVDSTCVLHPLPPPAP